MQLAASIFLTLLVFLVGGNFDAACNRESSASPGDLCAFAVQKVFLTTDYTDNTDKREATDKSRCSEGEFRNLFLSVPICEIRGQKISSSANQNGHRTQIRELSGRIINNTFDKLHRLTAEKIERSTGVPPVSSNSALGTLAYSYDLVGNRQSRTTTGSTALTSLLPNQTQSFTVNDRLTSDTYDANGNTTSSSSPITSNQSPLTNVTDVYSFDNKLIRRATPDGKTIDLTYNPDGHRLAKLIVQGGLTQRLHHYLTDANNPTGYAQVIEEIDPLAPTAEQLKKVHLYGHDLVASSVYQPSTLNHQLLFYSYDGLGSVRSLSNEFGDLQETYDYDAYGTLIGLAKRNPTSGYLESSDLNSSDSALRTPASEFLFTGEQRDEDFGMYFLRARYLNTDTGRFHTQDTYQGERGSPLSLHKYLYTHGNPVNGTDPSGNFFFQSSPAIGRAIEGAVANKYEPDFGVSRNIDVFFGKTLGTSISSPPGSIRRRGPRGGLSSFIISALKPDIVDIKHDTWNEIKPLTPSGISSGLVQWTLYDAVLSPTFSAQSTWTPNSIGPFVGEVTALGKEYLIINLNGILFYTRVEIDLADIAAAAALAGAGSQQAAAARLAQGSLSATATRGGGLALRGLIAAGQNASMAQVTSGLQIQTTIAVNTRL